MTELEKEAQEICSDFLSLDIVKKYLAAKDALNKEERLIKLRKEILDSKKNLKNIPFASRGEEVKRIKGLEQTYDDDSLVCNYNSLKSEVEELEEPIKSIFVF